MGRAISLHKTRRVEVASFAWVSMMVMAFLPLLASIQPVFAAAVYSNDFEGENPPSPEWTSTSGAVQISTTPNGRHFLGRDPSLGFSNETVRLTLTDLPMHTSITVSFDLYIIHSWDGNDGAPRGQGPDVWKLAVAGGATLLQTTFANVGTPADGTGQSYPGTFPGSCPTSCNPPRTGAAEVDSLGYAVPGVVTGDAVYRLSLTFPHSASSLVLNFTASNLQSIGDESWGLDNVRVSAAKAADLTIIQATPVQAVFDADANRDGALDLVADRPTALLVTVRATGVDSQEAELVVRLGTQEVSMDVVVSEGEGQIPLIFTPTAPGASSETVELVVEIRAKSDIGETNLENNRHVFPRPISVIGTKVLPITYVAIPACRESLVPCYGTVAPLTRENVGEHARQGTGWVFATFPVPDAAGTISSLSLTGSPINQLDSQGTSHGLIRDLFTVYAAGKQTSASTKRSVGIVPKDYFEYHGECSTNECTVGAHHTSVPGSVLVQVDEWATTAHEIAHTFREIGLFGPDDHENNVVRGYFVFSGKHLTAENLMSSLTALPAKVGVGPEPIRWISRERWESLFRQLRTNMPDPALLLVSALVNIDGSVEILPWYKVGEGTPDLPRPGPFTLRLTDRDGRTLVSVPFDLPFEIEVHPFGFRSTDVSGFAFTIPYPENTVLVSVEAPDGSPILQFDPVGKVLGDAIRALPERCFAERPAQRKNALLNKVAAIQSMLDAGGVTGALEKLRHDIRPHVEGWVLVDCAKEHALEASREVVLSLIEDAIGRLENR